MKHSILFCIVLFSTLMVYYVSAVPLAARSIKSCYKNNARLTQYWIPKEGDKDMLNNGKVVRLTGSKTKKLKTSSGKTIAEVAPVTYDKFQMEGTGLLQDGTMVNLGSSNNVFEEINREKNPYGLGSNGNSLVPWVSVASNDIKRGTTLYVKEFDGLKLPDGKTHNGCVRVDDEGWSFDGCQLDFFVLQFSAYTELSDKLPDKIHVTEKKCSVKNYVTKSVQKWAVI